MLMQTENAAPTFDKPRKVTFPNGVVIWSFWYEHPILTSTGKLRKNDDDVRRIQRKYTDYEFE